MDPQFLTAVKAAFPAEGAAITLGAPVLNAECQPQPLVRLPLAMMTRHGLIAGATGTGKTKSLQLMAEQLSAQGVPVFLADIKGDVSGIGAAGETNDKIAQRSRDTGWPWSPNPFPVEYLSLAGTRGAQLRATVSSFGPLLLSKVLELNDTQASVLSLVFKYCDDQKLTLLDLADLRAVLQYLTDQGAADLKDYGGISKATVGVLLRDMVVLEQQGADKFFGEPAFELDDLLQTERDGRGLVSVLELQDVQDRPALFSTFMMWMLASLYHQLPEVGDLDKPKLVFFFDEAHLVFDGASKEFLTQVQQVVRLIRSKGVGVFFITQSPKDIPADILGQLGNRVQHALRAFTPDDQAALSAAARTFPTTPFYDVERTLTSLGIGEALVTVLKADGSPTPPVVSRMIPPASRMGPLNDAEMNQRLNSSKQAKEYAQAIDRESAREMLASRMTPVGAGAPERAAPASATVAATIEGLAGALNSPLVKIIAGRATTQIMRGLMGAMLGSPPRRRSRSIF